MTDNPSHRPSDELNDRRGSDTPTDPDPDNTPGLEPGNGVMPGDTPPGEASTSGNTYREPKLPSSGTNKAVYVGILAVVLVSVLTFIGYAVGVGN